MVLINQVLSSLISFFDRSSIKKLWLVFVCVYICFVLYLCITLCIYFVDLTWKQIYILWDEFCNVYLLMTVWLSWGDPVWLTGCKIQRFVVVIVVLKGPEYGSSWKTIQIKVQNLWIVINWGVAVQGFVSALPTLRIRSGILSTFIDFLKFVTGLFCCTSLSLSLSLSFSLSLSLSLSLPP